MMTTDELASLLGDLYHERDEELRSRYNRSLPCADGIFDRWERAKRLGFGEESSVYNSAIVIGDVHVGAHTWVGPSVFLDGGYDKLRIGAYCSISASACLYTHDTVMWSLSGGASKPRTGAVTVEDRCYIGSQVIVGPGVRIGEQSVIATNSFVNCDVQARTIVAGNPARVIGRVEQNGDDIRLIYDNEDRKR